MAHLEIEQFYCREDNFGVLIHDPETGLTAAIDAPEELAIRSALARRGWKLDFIFTTHHHFDHVAANEALKHLFGARITGPSSEKIPALDHGVKDGDRFSFGSFEVQVIATPGHTAGEVCYYLPQARVVFTGDTLFALGCGRLFEGTPADMFASLQKLALLPVDTQVYCGHEYTLSNLRFALDVDGNNPALKERGREIERLRAEGLPTLPTTIGLEMATNPFLRVHDAAIARRLNMENADPLQIFTELRKRKDHF
ncbi:hydroxyacylglutathione hydrolase [Pseudochrobactrum sp. HB0163]|uniref:hydroxyacylglutathione hydrolase n=1 Tax=Pseudochrobactrum sp. HB0163 TaxID=3450708 RepID=UPI003F6DB2B2